MFFEQNNNDKNGWIEVITGSMFSGKTEELIRRIKRVQIANQSIIVFKPSVDTRHSEDKIVSHANKSFNSIAVADIGKLETLSEGYNVVAFDEAQFFEPAIVKVCQSMANKGKRVIVAGLDMDFSGGPFGPIPMLLAVAEYVTKLHAICPQCGNLAQFSYRTTSNRDQILVGDKDRYTPLCRNCYTQKL